MDNLWGHRFDRVMRKVCRQTRGMREGKLMPIVLIRYTVYVEGRELRTVVGCPRQLVVAVWSAGISVAANGGGQREVVPQLVAGTGGEGAWVDHHGMGGAEDAVSQLHVLLMVHGVGDSVALPLVLLGILSGILSVHHQRSGIREGWRFSYPWLCLLLRLLHLEIGNHVNSRFRVLQEKERLLRCERLFSRCGDAGSGLPMCAQTRGGNVRFATGGTNKRTLIIVQSFVQFQVDILCETCRTLIAAVRFLATVQSHVCLQIRC